MLASSLLKTNKAEPQTETQLKPDVYRPLSLRSAKCLPKQARPIAKNGEVIGGTRGLMPEQAEGRQETWRRNLNVP
jgi:hypothetical protein